MIDNGTRFIHPNVFRWINNNVSKKLQKVYTKELQIFLQDIWGPVVNYQFDSLKAGYPYPCPRFHNSLYLYDSNVLLAFEMISDAMVDDIVEGRCSQEEYNFFVRRKSVLSLSGWRVLSYTIDMLEQDTSRHKEWVEKIRQLAVVDSRAE
jgi:hypothetical protein